MSDLPIVAHVVEDEKIGAFYPVRLQCVPQVGDLIRLTSLKDSLEKQPTFTYAYEVVKVAHEVHDFIEDNERYNKGAHSISIFVKKSQDQRLFS